MRLRVRGDGRLLTIPIDNLAANAIRYRDGRGEVVVRSGPSPKARRWR